MANYRTNISLKWEKIIDNDGVYMTIATSDMIISKKTSLTYDTNLNL